MAAWVTHSFGRDLSCGAIYLFRSRRADRLKILVSGGSGTVMLAKCLNGGQIKWLERQMEPVALSKVQHEALYEGLDWTPV
ncbi:transposase [Paracoccus aminophilus JCM 7686]|uniref:Transposase n=1 Tax=Paracoccus aminophilus JCM 7686 TaxID=1367847 RepID=S5XZ96_PARAH|nr:transposase [Paracoccus aminophilus JCM 7686]